MANSRVLWHTVLCLTLISGCGSRNDTEGRQATPQPVRIQTLPTDGTSVPSDAANDVDQQLAGGSEAAVRPVQPMNNSLLRKEFPNVFAMHGPSANKQIAITFDDGPDIKYTPQILDILRKHDVKATFFVMGSRVAGHPDIAKRIHQEGHLLANHTYWHPKLFREEIARMKWEVTETDKAIRSIVGYSPKLFRAPYGGLNDSLLKELGDMNYSVIGWTVDSRDWTQADSETVKSNVRSTLDAGSIVLFHSGGDWTQNLSGGVQALDELIPQLKKEGYQFVTVSELLGIQGSK